MEEHHEFSLPHHPLVLGTGCGCMRSSAEHGGILCHPRDFVLALCCSMPCLPLPKRRSNVAMERVKLLKEVTEHPNLILKPSSSRDYIEFGVYNFLSENFDEVYVGYPIFFIFPNATGRAKVYLSASEVGARVADVLEAKPEYICELSFHDGYIYATYFDPTSTEVYDISLFATPVIGSA